MVFIMKATPITQELLSAWSQDYNASEARQLATLALGKTDLKDAIFSARDAFAMQPKFSIDIPTLPVANQQHTGRCCLSYHTSERRKIFPERLFL